MNTPDGTARLSPRRGRVRVSVKARCIQVLTGHCAIVPWHRYPLLLNKHWHPLRIIKQSQSYLLNYPTTTATATTTATHYYNHFTALWILSRTTWVIRHQKDKTHLDLLEQEIVSGSGISWAICRSAPHPRHNHSSIPPVSFFTGRMPFLPPNQQHQSRSFPSLFCNSSCHSFVSKAVYQSRQGREVARFFDKSWITGIWIRGTDRVQYSYYSNTNVAVKLEV